MKQYLRFVVATVSIKFPFSSGVKAITTAHAAASASTGGASATAAATSSHRPVTNGSKERDEHGKIPVNAQVSLPIRGLRSKGGYLQYFSCHNFPGQNKCDS